MRLRSLRVVVVLVLIVIGGMPMLRGSAAGTASLYGQPLVVCPEWDPTCSYEPPSTYLARLVYTAHAPSANTLTFEFIPSYNEAACLGYGPGSCGTVGTGPDRFVFTEGNTDISASGLCNNVGTKAASCQAPANGSIYELFPPNAVPSLPVVISTGDVNDQVTIALRPMVQEFAFSIDTGVGNDVIVLVDGSGHVHGGADQVACGPGTDNVRTTLDVAVASDCETVTRLT